MAKWKVEHTQSYKGQTIMIHKGTGTHKSSKAQRRITYGNKEFETMEEVKSFIDSQFRMKVERLLCGLKG